MRKYDDAAYAYLIDDDHTTLEFDSIFQFDHKQLTALQASCNERDVTLYFRNEDLTVEPYADPLKGLELCIYSAFMDDKLREKILGEYERYRKNCSKGIWIKKIPGYKETQE